MKTSHCNTVFKFRIQIKEKVTKGQKGNLDGKGQRVT